MINISELKRLAKERGLRLSNDFIKEIDKLTAENIKKTLEECFSAAKNSERKTLKVQDLLLINKLRK